MVQIANRYYGLRRIFVAVLIASSFGVVLHWVSQQPDPLDVTIQKPEIKQLKEGNSGYSTSLSSSLLVSLIPPTDSGGNGHNKLGPILRNHRPKIKRLVIKKPVLKKIIAFRKGHSQSLTTDSPVFVRHSKNGENMNHLRNSFSEVQERANRYSVDEIAATGKLLNSNIKRKTISPDRHNGPQIKPTDMLKWKSRSNSVVAQKEQSNNLHFEADQQIKTAIDFDRMGDLVKFNRVLKNAEKFQSGSFETKFEQKSVIEGPSSVKQDKIKATAQSRSFFSHIRNKRFIPDWIPWLGRKGTTGLPTAQPTDAQTTIEESTTLISQTLVAENINLDIEAEKFTNCTDLSCSLNSETEGHFGADDDLVSFSTLKEIDSTIPNDINLKNSSMTSEQDIFSDRTNNTLKVLPSECFEEDSENPELFEQARFNETSEMVNCENNEAFSNRSNENGGSNEVIRDSMNDTSVEMEKIQNDLLMEHCYREYLANKEKYGIASDLSGVDSGVQRWQPSAREMIYPVKERDFRMEMSVLDIVDNLLNKAKNGPLPMELIERLSFKQHNRSADHVNEKNVDISSREAQFQSDVSEVLGSGESFRSVDDDSEQDIVVDDDIFGESLNDTEHSDQSIKPECVQFFRDLLHNQNHITKPNLLDILNQGNPSTFRHETKGVLESSTHQSRSNLEINTTIASEAEFPTLQRTGNQTEGGFSSLNSLSDNEKTFTENHGYITDTFDTSEPTENSSIEWRYLSTKRSHFHAITPGSSQTTAFVKDSFEIGSGEIRFNFVTEAVDFTDDIEEEFELATGEGEPSAKKDFTAINDSADTAIYEHLDEQIFGLNSSNETSASEFSVTGLSLPREIASTEKSRIFFGPNFGTGEIVFSTEEVIKNMETTDSPKTNSSHDLFTAFVLSDAASEHNMIETSSFDLNLDASDTLSTVPLMPSNLSELMRSVKPSRSLTPEARSSERQDSEVVKFTTTAVMDRSAVTSNSEMTTVSASNEKKNKISSGSKSFRKLDMQLDCSGPNCDVFPPQGGSKNELSKSTTNSEHVTDKTRPTHQYETRTDAQSKTSNYCDDCMNWKNSGYEDQVNQCIGCQKNETAKQTENNPMKAAKEPLATVAYDVQAQTLQPKYCSREGNCDASLNEKCVDHGLYSVCDCGRYFIRHPVTMICTSKVELDTMLRFPKETYSEDLKNNDSVVYKEKKLAAENMMWMIVQNNADLVTSVSYVKAIDFQPGSLIVLWKMVIATNGNMTADEEVEQVVNELRSTLRDQELLSKLPLKAEDAILLSVSQAINPCEKTELNYCSRHADCVQDKHRPGGFRCKCNKNFKDFSKHKDAHPGEICRPLCPTGYCGEHGTCQTNPDGGVTCTCIAWFIGERCEVSGVVLVASSSTALVAVIFAVVAAVYWVKKCRRSSSYRRSMTQKAALNILNQRALRLTDFTPRREDSYDVQPEFLAITFHPTTDNNSMPKINVIPPSFSDTKSFDTSDLQEVELA